MDLTLLRHDPSALQPVDPAHFSGSGRVQRLGGSPGPPPVRLYRVELDAGCRTNWHAHSGPQLLLVIEGRCLVQRRQGPLEQAGAGDVVVIPPGVEHWHGASGGAPMVHVAVNVDASTTWLEAVDRT